MDELKDIKNHSPIIIAPYYSGVSTSIIITKEGKFYSNLKPNKVLDEYCLLYGSTLAGRKEATRRQFGFIKNPPILVSEKKKIVALELPCEQYKGESIWVLQLDFDIKPIEKNKCIIRLDSQTYFIVPLSVEAVKRRKTRAIELLYNFMN